ncbi:cell division protein PerM [Streptomyces termitum]|uniref:cell division protein PerM n=1 Tax=Streptomyces termitum TaxID=67368 RepID=UPI0033AF7810
MTHLTEHSLVRRGTSAAFATACVRGGIAAGLGAGALAVLVVVAWISSPFPDGDAGGALHLAAGLWLLAHGVDLVRTDALGGVPAPLGLAPLLLAGPPLWLVFRAVRGTLAPADETRPRPSPAGALGAVSGGYLLVAAVIVVYSESGPFPADLVTAGLWLPGAVLGAAGAGVWASLGRPLPGREEAAAALYGAASGLVALLGGGAVLAGTALVWRAGAARAAFDGIAGEWSGRVALGLLLLALLPNAAVWAAAYGLGPGFALGTGVLATPLGLAGDPALPPFPLLAAVPPEGRGGWPQWAALAVPLLAAVLLGRAVGRETGTGPARGTALAALGAAGAYALGVAVLAGAAAGPLGSGRLRAFGPVWWQAGGAAAGWALLLGLPTALAVRAWGRRVPRPKEPRAPKSPTGPEAAGQPGEAAPSGARSARLPALFRTSLFRASFLRLPSRRRVPQDGPVPGEVRAPVPVRPASPRGPDPLDVALGLDDEGYEPYDYLPASWESGPGTPDGAPKPG